MEKLLKKEARVIVLSYNSEGIIKFGDIIDMFKGRKLDVYRIDYEKFNSHSEIERRKVFEYIFVGCKDESGILPPEAGEARAGERLLAGVFAPEVRFYEFN